MNNENIAKANLRANGSLVCCKEIGGPSQRVTLRKTARAKARGSEDMDRNGISSCVRGLAFVKFAQQPMVFACVAMACISWIPTELAFAKDTDADAVVITASKLYVGDGPVIENGMVIVRGDRIVSVGQHLTVPKGAKKISLRAGSITPGLIDANASVAESGAMMLTGAGRYKADHKADTEAWHRCFGLHDRSRKSVGCCGSRCSRAFSHVTGEKCEECGFPHSRDLLAVGTRSWQSLAEGSSEITPQLRVIDSVNLRSPDFDRLVAGGVTTVFVAPDSAAVISARGAIVHTAGPVSNRIMREADSVKATMGTDPSWRGRSNGPPSRRRTVDFHVRRPTTRMGVTWIFRKAMLDANNRRHGVAIGGADTASQAALDVIEQVRAGTIPLRIQARQHHDILSAIRLADEFNLSFVLEEATEAHKCLKEIKQRHIPVVFGPIYIKAPGYRASSSEVENARLYTMKALLDAGITTALTAQELRDEDGLARQAMYATRYGLSREQVLKAVTTTPAQILGIDKEVGSLEVGKRADLILWTGQPFDATSKPAVVMVGGKIVVDRRKQS